METATKKSIIDTIRENSYRCEYTYFGGGAYFEDIETGTIYGCDRGKEHEPCRLDKQGNVLAPWYLVRGR